MWNTVIEIFGVVTGLLYIFFEVKHNKYMWLLGIFIAVAYTYVFAVKGLYAVMAFQIFNFFLSIYGLIKWEKDERDNAKSEDSKKMVINKLGWKETVISVVVTVGLYFLLDYLLGFFTDESHPILDTIITVLSLLATYWLSRSFIEQWLVWIVVNVLSVILYVRQGMYPTVVLYSAYTIVAFYGYYYWRKQ